MHETLRPKVELLGPGLLDQIVDEGLTVLERTGIFVENAEARALLAGEGARVEAARDRVRIPRKVVERLLAQTPSEITLFDRAGEKSLSGRRRRYPFRSRLGRRARPGP